MSITIFSSLPTEIICLILCRSYPEDLANIQLVSRKLHSTCLEHERFICRGIATYQRILHGSFQNQQRRPLFVLHEQWRRHLIIESLLPIISPDDGPTRQSLHDMWNYKEASKTDQSSIIIGERQRFVESMSPKDLISLISTIRTCGQPAG